MVDRNLKFITSDPDEIKANEGISIPKRLKPIVSNAPKENVDKYLERLVSEGKIVQDDIIFLLESGALLT
jgi:hypothetical protein